MKILETELLVLREVAMNPTANGRRTNDTDAKPYPKLGN